VWLGNGFVFKVSKLQFSNYLHILMKPGGQCCDFLEIFSPKMGVFDKI
jgi:hypothetical protein